MRIPKIFILAICLIVWGGKAVAALPASQQYTLAPMLATATTAVVNISTEGRVELRFNPLFNNLRLSGTLQCIHIIILTDNLFVGNINCKFYSI